MTKQDIQKRILQNGEPLPLNKFTWDEKTKSFSSNENDLVLDFNGINGVTFKTGGWCTFYTGSRCTFDTGDYCTFKTGNWCTFYTDHSCSCTFDTGSECVFNTGGECTFKTGDSCTFDTGYNCTFKTGEECVIIRRDIYEVIEIPMNKKIKLNDYQIKGYTFINDEHVIIIDGKEIKLSEESYNNLKEQLI